MFGQPNRESGISSQLSRAHRAVSKHVKTARRTLTTARSNIVRTAKSLDARACKTIADFSRRTGNPLTAEYVRGALHTSLGLVGTGLVCIALARGAARIRTAADLPPRLIGSGRSFKAIVARVGDGDGMRVVHLPPLRVPLVARRRLPKARAADTVSVRLAGVDAPECAHFGQPGQKYGKAAREWLDGYVVGQRVRVVVHAVDQYHRALASVYKPRRFFLLKWLGLGERNVSVELARAGYATLYEGANAQFGGARRQIAGAIESAKRKRVGMWAAKGVLETPAEFKRRLKSGAALKDPVAQFDLAGHKTGEKVSVKEVVGVARRIYDYLKSLR